MKDVGDGKRRAQPEAEHALGARDHVGGRGESLDRSGRGQILQMLGERGENILHQRRIAFAVAAHEQFLGTAAIAVRASPHGVGVKLAHVVIAGRGRGAARGASSSPAVTPGALGLFARRQQRDIVGMIDHPARCFAQLRRHHVVAGAQPAIERRQIHASKD